MKKFNVTIIIEIEVLAESKKFASEVVKKNIPIICNSGCGFKDGGYFIQSGKWYIANFDDIGEVKI
jgi:hypothetical protein